MNLLGVGNLIESPRQKQTHPKITKENVNDLFKGQSHASWFAERNDLESLRELFETFQCTRLRSGDGSSVRSSSRIQDEVSTHVFVKYHSCEFNSYSRKCILM